MHNLLKFIPLLAVVAFTGNVFGVCGENFSDSPEAYNRISPNANDRLYNTKTGLVYECDSDKCPNESSILVDADFFQISGRSVYICSTGVDDIWVDMTRMITSCGPAGNTSVIRGFYKEPDLSKMQKQKFVNTDQHNYYRLGGVACLVENNEWIECKTAYDSNQDVYWNTEAQKCYCRSNNMMYENGKCTNRSDNGDSQNNNGGGNNEDGGKNNPFCPFTNEGFSSTITVPSNCSAPNQFVGAIEVVKDYVTKFEFKYKTIGYTEYMAASPKPEILCGKCIESGDSNPCMRAIADGESVVWNGTKCLCVGKKAGYDWDQQQGKCIQQQQHKSCVEQRGCATMPSSAREACQLCCNAKKDVATWDRSTRQCNCTNGAVFDINAQSGKWCEAKQQSKFICPPDSELDAWEHEFATNNAIMNIITDIRNRCSDDTITEPQYNRYKDQIRTLIANSKVDDLSGKLSDMQAKFTTSHWTDKEGNFNKKRLLSDSIAATVLGTTGGLITSH
ncbi:MAG: hypothetical protein MJ187_04725, partial [Alphaproteobacteria bacterium]|nr:hypothetical protein [Alphaproteobacteria bacterium]